MSKMKAKDAAKQAVSHIRNCFSNSEGSELSTVTAFIEEIELELEGLKMREQELKKLSKSEL